MDEPYNEPYAYFRKWVTKYMPCPLGHQYDTERMLADDVVSRLVRRHLEANRCPVCIGVWLRCAFMSRVFSVDLARLPKESYMEIVKKFEDEYQEYAI